MFYLNVFLLFSIMGYSYETLFRFFKGIVQHNLLLGPWMPIYGFGILISEFVNLFLNKFLLKGKKKIFLFFILNVLLLTILEEIGALFIRFFFQTAFWNYEDIPLHIGPYINVFVSLVWGICAVFMEYVLIPILTPFIKKIPKGVSFILLIFLLLDHLWMIFTKLNICFFNVSFTFMGFFF